MNSNFQSKFIVPTLATLLLVSCSSFGNLLGRTCNKKIAFSHGRMDSKTLDKMTPTLKNCVASKTYSLTDYTKDYEIGFQKGLSELCSTEAAYNHGASDYNSNLPDKWQDYLKNYVTYKNRVQLEGCIFITNKYSLNDYEKDYHKGYIDADKKKKELDRLERDRLDRESCNKEKAFNEGAADGQSSDSGIPSLTKDICLNSKHLSHDNYKKAYISGFAKEFCSPKKVTEKAAEDAEELSVKTPSSYFKICNNLETYNQYLAHYNKTLKEVCAPINIAKLGTNYARNEKSSSEGLEAIKVCPNSASVVNNFKSSYDSEKHLMLREESLRLERERAAREERARQESLRLERERTDRAEGTRQESLRLERERLEIAKKNAARDEKWRKENTCRWNSDYSCKEKTINSACQKTFSGVGACVVTEFQFGEPVCGCQ